MQQGCDVICVNLVDRTAAAVIVDKAQAAGVPVIFFNREPVEEDLERWEKACYVGTPAEEAGRLQGGIVLDAWKKDPCRTGQKRRRHPPVCDAEGEPAIRTPCCGRNTASRR